MNLFIVAPYSPFLWLLSHIIFPAVVFVIACSVLSCMVICMEFFMRMRINFTLYDIPVDG